MVSTKLQYPKVSVCIPVYNVELYIERCLISIMNQTYTGEIECVIVDDFGTDHSIAIAEQLIAGYNGPITFYVIHHTHNRGLAAARNTAVEAAKGDFIIHVDSDDWLETTAIERLIKKQQETGADIVSGNAIIHYRNHEEELIEPDYSDKESMLRNTLKLSLDHVLWRRLIRASLYKDNGIMAVEGANLGEDHYTLPRLIFFANSVSKVREIIYHYSRENENSYCNQKNMLFKYNADMTAISILQSFFMEHDSRYFSELEDIKQEYIAYMKRVAMVMRDKYLFYHIVDDSSRIDKVRLSLAHNYYFCQLKRIIQKMVRKFFNKPTKQ